MCQKQLGLGNESKVHRPKNDATLEATSENHRPFCPLDLILSALLATLGYFFRPFRIIIGKWPMADANLKLCMGGMGLLCHTHLLKENCVKSTDKTKVICKLFDI